MKKMDHFKKKFDGAPHKNIFGEHKKKEWNFQQFN